MLEFKPEMMFMEIIRLNQWTSWKLKMATIFFFNMFALEPGADYLTGSCQWTLNIPAHLTKMGFPEVFHFQILGMYWQQKYRTHSFCFLLMLYDLHITEKNDRAALIHLSLFG